MSSAATYTKPWVNRQQQRIARYVRRRWRSAVMWACFRTNLRRLNHIRRTLARERRIVAIVLVEHFGDIVACEPVTAYLRRQHPDALLLWVCTRSYRELVEPNPNLDGCVTVTCLDEALKLAANNAFDEVVNLHVNNRYCRWRETVFHRVDGDPNVTWQNYYDFGSLLEAFCRTAGLPVLSDAPQFYFASPRPAKVRSWLPTGPYLVLHAATNEGGRDWPVEKWRQLVRQLRTASAMTLVEIGLQPVVSVGNPDVLDLCGRFSLQELASVIRDSTGFVGIDSGPAHIANALRVPSVILLGHYLKWKRYMPYSGFFREQASRMLIRWDGPAADIPVDECLTRIRTQWPEQFQPYPQTSSELKADGADRV